MNAPIILETQHIFNKEVEFNKVCVHIISMNHFDPMSTPFLHEFTVYKYIIWIALEKSFNLSGLLFLCDH